VPLPDEREGRGAPGSVGLYVEAPRPLPLPQILRRGLHGDGHPASPRGRGAARQMRRGSSRASNVGFDETGGRDDPRLPEHAAGGVGPTGRTHPCCDGALLAGRGSRQDEDRALHLQRLPPASRGTRYVRHSMERLRVLWLIKGLGAGGAEQLLVSMAGARDRAIAEVDVAYLLPWKDALVPALAETGVNVTCLGVTNERDPRWALGLRRLIAERQYDVVHVHSPYAAGVVRLVA